MTILHHNELKSYIQKTKIETFPSTVMLYGDEFLTHTALDDILNRLVPESKRQTNMEWVDGSVDAIPEAVEKLNTFSLIPGKKVLLMADAKFFYSALHIDTLLEKAKRAKDENNMALAARHFVAVLALLRLSFEDVSSDKKNKKLKMDQNSEWMHPLIQYCMEQNTAIPTDSGHTAPLEKAIDKGFPKDNHLIITTDIADKKHRLFQRIVDKGLVVDCSVPKSGRAADKKVQTAVTSETSRRLLQKHKKTMNKKAADALYEMTGFDLRTFSGNLEKLISYVGDRQEITVEDVKTILDRTKTDPIYELTNAILERNTENALFYLDSLLTGGIIEHPLQILSAIINQMRKLLLVKDFTQSPYGNPWTKECSYDQFRSNVLPAIAEYDNAMIKQIQDYQPALPDAAQSGDYPSGKNQKKKKIPKNDRRIQDVMIAKNPNNPFPIYKMLKHSENFSRTHLVKAYAHLHDVDTRLKSSPPAGHKIVLEEAVLTICQRSETLESTI